MFFEIEIELKLYFKQHFETEEVILKQPRKQVLYFYSTTVTRFALGPIEERSRSICDVIHVQRKLFPIACIAPS